MESELLLQILTVGGPMALFALAAIAINYKLTMRWMDTVEVKLLEISKVLGRVNESLRRLNGK